MTGRSVPEPAEDAPKEERIRAHARRVGAQVVRSLFRHAVREEAGREAAADLRKLVELDPAAWSNWVNLHWLLARQDARAAGELLDRMELLESDNAFLAVYVARLLNDRRKHDRALKVLSRATVPQDGILQHEYTIELLRAHAGRGDLKALAESFEQRFQDVDDEIERFHLAFHVDSAAASQAPSLYSGIDPAAAEVALKGMVEKYPHGLCYSALLVSFYARLGRREDEVRSLLSAVERFPQTDRLGRAFQHFFYRYVWRLLESQLQTGVP